MKPEENQSQAGPGGRGADGGVPARTRPPGGDSAGGAAGSVGGGVEVAPRVSLPESELRFTFSRSSGPGGQNVNKISSKARLCVALSALEARIGPMAVSRLVELAGPAKLTDAGDLVLVSEESRSQHANRRACMERLRAMLIEALRPRRKRRATRPSRGSKERRLDSKKQRGDIKRQRGGGSFDG